MDKDDILVLLCILAFIGIVVGVITSSYIESNWEAVQFLWIIEIIIIVSFAEILFWWDVDKPKKKESVFWFVVKEKAFWLVLSAFFVIGFSGWLLLANETVKFFGADVVMSFIGYGTFWIVVVVCGIYAYIRLNSLKYRNLKYPKSKRRKKNKEASK